ncbi:hypothetical protein VTO73DRAFT_9494 [Trametes versicolor]
MSGRKATWKFNTSPAAPKTGILRARVALGWAQGSAAGALGGPSCMLDCDTCSPEQRTRRLERTAPGLEGMLLRPAPYISVHALQMYTNSLCRTYKSRNLEPKQEKEQAAPADGCIQPCYASTGG